MRHDIDPEAFLESVMRFMDIETDPQIFRQIITYAERCTEIFVPSGNIVRDKYENYLFQIADNHRENSFRTLALKSFANLASSDISIDLLYHIWESTAEAARYKVSERDLIHFSYTLACYMPGKANDILNQQLSRITNPDRQKEYAFVMQALMPVKEQRMAFFDRLLQQDSWAVEPWAQSALRWLNHPVRYPESLAYIRPALEVLLDIQREGDIFFPANWCAALLSGHTSDEANRIVEDFIMDHPDYPILMGNKIRQFADHLKKN